MSAQLDETPLAGAEYKPSEDSRRFSVDSTDPRPILGERNLSRNNSLSRLSVTSAGTMNDSGESTKTKKYRKTRKKPVDQEELAEQLYEVFTKREENLEQQLMMLEKENEHFQRAEARALEAQAEAQAEKAAFEAKAEMEAAAKAEAERAKELALEKARREKEELEEKARREKLELAEKLAAAEKAIAAEKAEAEKAAMIAAAEKAALKAMLDQQAAEAEAHRRRRQEQYKSFQQQRPSAERMASSSRGRSFDSASLRRGCVTIDEEPTVINSPRRGSSKRTGTSAPPGEQGARSGGGLASKVAHAVGGVAVTGLVATVVTGMLARDAVINTAGLAGSALGAFRGRAAGSREPSPDRK